MRVLVIGAGTGGLCLAHGLHRAGVDVTVFERDRDPQHKLLGYRVGISPDGSRALAECLPPEVFAEFVRTCARPIRHVHMRTEKLRTLLSADVEPGDDPIRSEKSVSRTAMRKALLTGLEDVVEFDKTFTRFARNDDGTVTAFFADGTSATGDVLVAADGANSRVRKQYLPQAQVVDSGVTAIAGKVWLTPETRELVPSDAEEAITLLFAPRGANLIVHHMVFEGEPADVSSPAEGASNAVEPDYVMWGYSASHDKFPDLSGATPERLKQAVLDLTPKWHPNLRALFAQADPETVFKIGIRTSEPFGAWDSSNVTLLGDAIHTMTPGRGIGANTALRDAQALCRELVAVHRGEASLIPAIASYEADMREYGFRAVLESRDQIDGSSPVHKPVIGRVMLAMFRTFLRVTNAVPALKRRFMASENELRDTEGQLDSNHEVLRAG
ncbi:FAD-dependent monooxygenase [Lentzea tibetensis]|uniref:FAD-dependent monooxygenase n=1 Tax=Lentzea tibetensis TaxID=2591470 RepID=A0A563EZ87_9PSEU|nr:NAD(P)/FAD-dependent oxidoreductase [Lentzea tibetensis]TWP52444.1 FAD-dependent monooxygenase [Lentzea tibetensis]